MRQRKNSSAVLFELPQLSFDLSAGRPRIVPLDSGHLRLHDRTFYRYCGRSRWYPDVSAPTLAEQRIRDLLLAQPTLQEGEACALLSA